MAWNANNIPPPAPLKVAGDAAADWERFKCEFENYEIATDLVDSDDKKRAAVYLACIGSAAHAIFRTFKFENDDERAKVDKIKESFDKHWLGEVNVTYERYVFHQRVCCTSPHPGLLRLLHFFHNRPRRAKSLVSPRLTGAMVPPKFHLRILLYARPSFRQLP